MRDNYIKCKTCGALFNKEVVKKCPICSLAEKIELNKVNSEKVKREYKKRNK